MGVTTLAAMPGTKRLAASLALLAAVAALSGCGSDEVSGEIPAKNAGDLNAALDDVSAAIASQDCVSAGDAADAFVAAVNQLPQDPSGELKPELQRAGDNLRTLVSDECPSTGTTQTTDTQPTTTQETTPSTTEETETSTTTEETQTTTTTTTEETTSGGGGPPGGVPPGQDGGTGGSGPGHGSGN